MDQTAPVYVYTKGGMPVVPLVVKLDWCGRPDLVLCMHGHDEYIVDVSWDRLEWPSIPDPTHEGRRIPILDCSAEDKSRIKITYERDSDNPPRSQVRKVRVSVEP